MKDEIPTLMSVTEDELRPGESPHEMPFEDTWREGVEGYVNAIDLNDGGGPTIMLKAPTSSGFWTLVHVEWEQFYGAMRREGFDVQWAPVEDADV